MPLSEGCGAAAGGGGVDVGDWYAFPSQHSAQRCAAADRSAASSPFGLSRGGLRRSLPRPATFAFPTPTRLQAHCLPCPRPAAEAGAGAPQDRGHLGQRGGGGIRQRQGAAGRRQGQEREDGWARPEGKQGGCPRPQRGSPRLHRGAPSGGLSQAQVSARRCAADAAGLPLRAEQRVSGFIGAREGIPRGVPFPPPRRRHHRPTAGRPVLRHRPRAGHRLPRRPGGPASAGRAARGVCCCAPLLRWWPAGVMVPGWCDTAGGCGA